MRSERDASLDLPTVNQPQPRIWGTSRGRFKLLEVYPPPLEEGIKKRPKGKEQLILRG